MKRGLIIFQRNLVLGKVKTRLAARIGDEEALSVYRKMVHYIHGNVQGSDHDNFIYYSDFIEPNPPSGFFCAVQRGNDLGERMLNAVLEIKAKGYDQILIIGSDCIELTSEDIAAAFDILAEKDLVIGPAEDGGYYLLGQKAILPALFENMEWSTENVFNETKKRVAECGLSLGVLRMLNDIDTYEDLEQSELLKSHINK